MKSLISTAAIEKQNSSWQKKDKENLVGENIAKRDVIFIVNKPVRRNWAYCFSYP